MSQRDRDARAAMREILRAGLQLAKVADCASLAEMAWSVADAMATERRKREAAEAPAPEHHACHAEIAAAMREGRDAGLQEAGDYVWKLCLLATREARIMLSNVRDGIIELMSQPITSMPSDEAPSPAPDIASLHAELAKLRAVAEAAASMGRTELEIDRRGAAGGLHTIGYNNAVEARKSAAIALAAALDAALPDWRSAP